MQERFVFRLFAAILFSPVLTFSQTKPIDDRPPRPSPQNQQSVATLVNINNWSMWIHANGISANSPAGQEGGFYPRQTGHVIFADGIIWGAWVMDGSEPLIRVGGNTYNSGLVPGVILAGGIAEDPNDPSVNHVWRIRRDFHTADLRLDAAELNQIDPEHVTDVQIQIVREQYREDWLAWPAHKGAPFYDAGNDGVYAPVLNSDGSPKLFPEADEPGLQNADQVVWLVANDLDVQIATQLYGSPPIGMEVQATLWGYLEQSLADIVFKRYRLIYKGTAATPPTATIDTMYVSQWSDTDLGNFIDDMANCDSSTSLAFTYNETNHDNVFQQYDLIPPAIGYDFVQGPLVVTRNPGDRAIWNFHEVSGAKNLPMTFCWWDGPGNADSDPSRGGNYNGSLQWWNILRGFRPRPESPPYPFVDQDGNSVRFTPNGDPVTGSGWLESHSGDKRMFTSTGPFAMALGDTQEVVIAVMGGLGADHLDSIVKLRDTDKLVQAAYDNLSLQNRPAAFARVAFAGSNASVRLAVDASQLDAQAAAAQLVTATGIVVVDTALFDDGAHDDDAAGDGVFANTIVIAAQQEGLFLNLAITNAFDQETTWPRMVSNITTAGPLRTIEPKVFSDHLNNDGIPNPGENVRYGFTFSNATAFDFEKLRVSAMPEFENKLLPFEQLQANSSFALTYDPADPNSFFTLQIPHEFSGEEIRVPVHIADNRHNAWRDTLIFRVESPPVAFTYAEVQHVAGPADGTFGVRIINEALVQDHLYAIYGVDSIDIDRNSGYALVDSTERRILLLNQPLPDDFGHNVPPTAGFKLTKGRLDYRVIGKDWNYQSLEPRWFTGGEHGGELFFGGVFLGPNFPSLGSSVVPSKFKTVELRFAAKTGFTDLNSNNQYDAGEPYNVPEEKTQRAWFYRSLSPDGYAGYKSVPFTVWDVDADPPRQLGVAVRDRDDNSQWDLHAQYSPDDPNFVDVNNGDFRNNYIFVLDVDYDPSGDLTGGGRGLILDMLMGEAPLLWVLWLDPLAGQMPLEAEGALTLVPNRQVSSNDVFIFNPTVLTTGIQRDPRPAVFALEQNYPNPFNPATTIRFSLPADSHVRMIIYDLLGRKVATLVDERMTAGAHTLTWSGENEQYAKVASGVYLYRLEAAGEIRTRKMVLLQ